MKKYPQEIFKAYDIRGIVETQLTPDVIEDIGSALGSMALDKKQSTLVVGFDGRLTSPLLAKRLIKGILKSGCNVYDIGMVTTPMVYFANFELKTNSGVMITGSHNPPEYNGLKIVINGCAIFGDEIQEVKKRLESNKLHHGQGSYQQCDIEETYIKKINENITLQRRMNIVVDCGNGVAGKIAPKLFRRLGCNVLGLFCEVDGTFPNHHPDPSQPKNLQDLIHAVKSTGAEFGLAFDGDGDRLGVITKDGQIIYPDRQMMLFSADILEKNPNAKIIYDVKSSKLLREWITQHGGIPVMCRTGHSYVKAKIKEINASLAGEMSGHIFFNDKWNGTDDAVYAGCRLLEILSQVDNPSDLLNALPNAVSTPELNIKVQDGEQHKIIENLQKTAKFDDAQEIITIDGLRVEYRDGFGLIRASNTTPVLVLRFEAENKTSLERIQQQFRSILTKYVDEINF